MSRTRVVLTVDTEPSIAGALIEGATFQPLIHEPVWGEINSKSEGLGFILRVLKRFDLKATFFVETAHVGYFGSKPMGVYVDYLLEDSQDVQLHIHPVWQNFSGGVLNTRAYNDNVSDQDCEEYAALIETGCQQIEQWTGDYPVAMRTGCFSCSRSVYSSMSSAGLKLSSNICIGYSSYDDDFLNLSGGVHDIEGILEVPATSYIDKGPIGKGQYRPIQVTACSESELIFLLEQCARASDENIIVITTHPFEFIKKSDFRYSSLRANRVVQKRFEVLCRFLSENTDKYETVTFKDLAMLKNFNEQPPLAFAVDPYRSFLRATQNFINDRF